MSGREYDTIQAFDEQLGLRELRAKVKGKLSFKDEFLPMRLPVCA